MTPDDKITSTEKLLNLIRGLPPENNTVSEPRFKGLIGRLTSMGSKGVVTVGVDIGYDRIRLVKIGKKRQLLDFREMLFSEDLTRASPKFHEFLRESLIDFGARRTRIWSTIPMVGVEMRQMRIPKVPKKQLANAALWSFKKENPYNDKEAFFDFDLLGEVIEDGVKKFEVLGYVAPFKDVEEVQELFNKAGFPLTGVTAVPFAVQNLLRTGWLPQPAGSICNLYIGRNWSRIDIFANNNMVLSRGIKTGMNSMIESVRDRYNEKLNQDSGGIVVEIEGMDFQVPDQEKPIDLDEARKIFQGLLAPDSTPPPIYIEPGELVDMVAPALDRLVRQLERTLEHYAQKVKGPAVTLVLTSGPINGLPHVLEYIGQQLGLPVEALDPMSAQAAFLTPRHQSSPQSITEREAYALAIGLALSSNDYTPNFIYTYKDKEKSAAVKRNHHLILIAYSIIMLVLGGIYLWENRTYQEKSAEAAKVRAELEQFTPRVSQELITHALGVIKQNQKTMAAYAQRYKGLALLNEVTAMTPPNVRLLDLSLELGQIPLVLDGDKTPAGAPVFKFVKIEGLVSGNRVNIEPSLAQYLLSMQMSPLLGQPSMQEQSIKVFQGREVLFFRADVLIK